MKSLQQTFREFLIRVKNRLSLLHTEESTDLFTWQPLDGNTHRALVKRFWWKLFWQHLKFKLGVSKPLSYAKGTLGVHLVALSGGKRVRCIHNQTGSWKVVDFDAPVLPLDPPSFKREKDERDDPMPVIPEPGISKSLMVKVALNRAAETPKLQTPELDLVALDKVLKNPPPAPPMDKRELLKKMDDLISALKDQQKKEPQEHDDRNKEEHSGTNR